jgi:hypothetical protein
MPIAFVDDDVFNPGASSGTLSWTPTVGNHLIYIGMTITAGATISGISQTNVTWARPTGPTLPYSVNRKIDLWVGTVGSSPGTNPNWGTGDYINYIAEFSGLSGAVSGTAYGGNNGSDATVESLAITPADSDVLIIAGSAIGASFTSGPDNGFTAWPSISGNSNRPAYRIITGASGSYSTTWTYGTSANWASFAIAFVAAGGGGATIGGPIFGGRAIRGLTRGRVLSHHAHPTISLEAYQRERARA